MTGKSFSDVITGNHLDFENRVTRLGGLPLVFRHRRDRYLVQKIAVAAVDGLALFIAAAFILVARQLGQTGALSWTGALVSLPSLSLYALFSLIAIVRFWIRGHYARKRTFWDELRETLQTLIALAALHLAVGAISVQALPIANALATWTLALFLVPVARNATKSLFLRWGLWQKPTVIVGAGQKAQEAYAALSSEPLLGFEVVAFLDPLAANGTAQRYLEVRGRAVPLRGLGTEPAQVIRTLGYPHVVIALDSEMYSGGQTMVERLQIDHNDLMVVPPVTGLPLLGMEMSHFFSHDVLFLQPRNHLARVSSRLLKRAFDIVASAAGLLVLAPLFFWLAWQVRKDGGPAIYGHRRVGLKGKYFNCYKFRSMVTNADTVLQHLLANDPEARAEWERDFKLKSDPRVTRIGAFLRRTSLDELPQLWNVLKGDMSLVGPRPVVDEELQRYGNRLRYYLFVRPGITGIWQISGRNDVDYSERIAFDTWYTKNWCLWYDIAILLRTVKIVFEGRGAY